MKYRFAKVSDAKQLATLHVKSGFQQTGSFMHLLGEIFWIKYYKYFLNEKQFIVLVAEQDQKIFGFVSGTLSAQEHLKYFNSIKFRLGVIILPRLILNPKLFPQIIQRLKFLRGEKNAPQYRVTEGVRIEYWAWDPDEKSLYSIELFKMWIDIIHQLGYESIKGEVDKVNYKVLKIHKMLGANVLGKLDTNDDRDRLIIEYKNKSDK